MRTRYVKRIRLSVALIALALASCGEKNSPPKADIWITDPDQQLNPMLLHEIQSHPGSSVEATYQIVNHSGNSCSITFESASCGCTSLEVDGKPLQIKEQFTLGSASTADLKLISRLPAKQAAYSFRAKLIAETTDGARRELPIRCGVQILGDIILSPDVLSHEFHSLDVATVTKSLVVERRWRGSPEKNALPTLSSLPPQLKILGIAEDQSLKEIEPGIWSRSWAIQLSMSPSKDLRSNPLRRMISVVFRDTPDSKSTCAELPVLLHLAFGIDAPESAHFGSIRTGDDRARRILLRAADNVEFAVLKVRSTSPAFSATMPSVKRGRVCWIELNFHPTEAKEYRANVTVETDHPTTRLVTISVRGAGTGQTK